MMTLESAVLGLAKELTKLAYAPGFERRKKAFEKQLFDSLMAMHDVADVKVYELNKLLEESQSIASEAIEKLHEKVN